MENRFGCFFKKTGFHFEVEKDSKDSTHNYFEYIFSWFYVTRRIDNSS